MAASLRGTANQIGKAAGIGTGLYETARTGNPLWLLTGAPRATELASRTASKLGRGMQGIKFDLGIPKAPLLGESTSPTQLGRVAREPSAHIGGSPPSAGTSTASEPGAAAARRGSQISHAERLPNTQTPVEQSTGRSWPPEAWPEEISPQQKFEQLTPGRADLLEDQGIQQGLRQKEAQLGRRFHREAIERMNPSVSKSELVRRAQQEVKLGKQPEPEVKLGQAPPKRIIDMTESERAAHYKQQGIKSPSLGEADKMMEARGQAKATQEAGEDLTPLLRKSLEEVRARKLGRLGLR